MPSPPLPAPFGQLRLPVMAAPMFIVSGPDLVIAQCKAGIIGSFPALNARPSAQLDEWLQRIAEELAAHDRQNPESPAGPFAVNLIVHRTNNRLQDDLALCEKHQVPLIITSLGAQAEVNAAVHGWGGIVLHDVINDFYARKAIGKGADGLIAVAAGAGGHAGVQSPFALMQEIRAWFDGPVALSGAIAGGSSILAAQAMGADFAYVGSAWIATDEANAVAGYKQAITENAAADIVYSNLFTGVHGNYLRPSIVAAGFDPDHLPHGDPSQMDFGAGGTSAAKAWKDIWGAGQGIGAIREVVPVATRVAQWADEYDQAQARLGTRLEAYNGLAAVNVDA
jgi:nitronate monooxygenase